MKKMKARKTLLIILAVVLLLLVAALVINSRFAFYNGRLLRRDITTLDLRGQVLTEREYAEAAKTFPDAYIFMDVQIGNRIFDADAESIVTGEFSEPDLDQFLLFRKLRSVDVSACSSMSAIEALRQMLPEADIFWSVPLGGTTYGWDTKELTLSGATFDELSAAITRLPQLTAVTVTGNAFTPQEEKTLVEEWSNITFSWDVMLGGKAFSGGDTKLDFSGTPLTETQLQEIDEYLCLMPHAESVDFSGCGLSDDTLADFSGKHPELAVGWEKELFGVQFNTLDTELVFDDIELTIEDAAQIEAVLPYMPKLEKVSMCRCGISNEDMDALNKRHENVKFVWMVQVQNYGIPTDQTYYCGWNCPYTYPLNNLSFDNLKYCTDLEAIDLGHQKLFGDDGTAFLASLTNLKYLTLCDCQYTSVPELAALKNLVFLEVYWTNMDDITPLKELTNLKALNIAYKRVRDVQNDIDVLCSMTWLEMLYVSGNMYSEETLNTIRAALPNTEIKVIETLNCCSMGWRSENKYYYDYRDALHMYYISDDSDQIFVNPFTGERSLYEDTNPF